MLNHVTNASIDCLNKIRKLKNIKLFQTFFTNLKYHKRIENKKKYIIVEGKVDMNISKNAKINLKGNLRLGTGSFGKSRETSLLMENGAILNINNSRICYGCDIKVFEKGIFSIGDSFINSDGKIRCQKLISIGDGCAIGTDVTIMDSDFHKFNGKLKTESIIIENHVWIGSRVTILAGVNIGEGAVIAAHSLVNKDIPAHTLAGGVPAKVLKENVTWG